ncbi:metallophosphoesterase family protein [Caldinitratiruptor microaerophilus]|uniref:Phosphoesterase n=1 Tax=Caldinitratiruptor microaerophilus TaxID=671077 RepID=A0AA35CMK0_9FIRM|nr:metallophosphoesterase family protein [Caldinitratiruptor microaerophilus]BDG60055.1 phosphoesterase [Caldinitratiruptor microaerophilus]
MKLAVFSDIHGNVHGLEAVLKDIEARGADVVWCGGDLVGYGANPGEVVEAIRRRGIPTVMGNYDDGVGYFRVACGCDYPDEAAMERGLRSMAWTKAHTTDDHKAFLRNLPYRLEREFDGHRVVLVHASPARLNEYLYEDVPDEVFRAHLAATGADVLVFGHTHVPFHKVLGGRHLVNCGSAGKPKHGNPNATYALLTLTPGHVAVDIIEVPYDFEAAARAIEATDLPPEFARMLREGRG